MVSRKKAFLVIALLLFSMPVVSADKLYGDALIYVSNTGESHPFVGSFNYIQGGKTNIDATRGSINLFEYPDSGHIEVSMADDAQDFDIYRTGSYVEKCTLSTFDHDPTSSEEGYVHVDQGVIIESNGEWPALPASDNFNLAYQSFDEGNLNGEKTALEIYKRMESPGFVYEDVNAGSAEILATSNGDKQLRLKGDMICGDANSDGNAEWYICDGNMQYSSSRIQSHECNEANGEWEEYDSNCADPVIGEITLTGPMGYSFDTNSAFWGYDATGEYEDTTTGCTYANAQPDSYNEYEEMDYSASPFGKDSPPITFECAQGDTNTIQGYPSVYDYDGIARDYIRDAKSSAQTYCEYKTDTDFETAGDPLPMVQFYYPIDSLPQDYGDGGNYVSTSGNYLGVENFEFSDLATALERYDGGTYNYICEECNISETWENKSLRNTDEYSDGNSDNFEEAWTVSNVGGSTDEDVKTSTGFEVGSYGTIDDNSVFPGGYAGDCQGTLTWQYDQEESEWSCSDDLPLTQELFVPTFDYPSDKDMVAVGFHMLPYLFNTTTTVPLGQSRPNSFSQEVASTFDEERKVQRVEAVCWWGKYGELKEEDEGDTWFALEYADVPGNPENPIPIFGELNKTVKQNRGLGGPSCRWVLHEADMDGNPTGEIYSTSGAVENKAGNIDAVEENRTYSSNQISVQDDYADDYKMNTDIFRMVSEEWQTEAGYNRIEEVNRNGYSYLSCLPGADHFHEGTNMC